MASQALNEHVHIVICAPDRDQALYQHAATEVIGKRSNVVGADILVDGLKGFGLPLPANTVDSSA